MGLEVDLRPVHKSIVLLEYDSFPIQLQFFQSLAQIVHHSLHAADINVDISAFPEHLQDVRLYVPSAPRPTVSRAT